MSDKQYKNKKQWGLTALCLINLLGLTYVGRQTYLLQQEQQASNNNTYPAQIEALQTEHQNLTEQLNQFQQNIAKTPRPKASLLHLRWLIQQAKWQMNILYQPNYSKQLLMLAQKIAIKQHWTAMEEAISHDLQSLEQQTLTDNSKLIGQLQGLQASLSTLQPSESFVKQEASKPEATPDYIKVFKPFVQIEKIKPDNIKVVPPSEQQQVIQNMQLLLPQIQYAGISHQQNLFLDLVNQLNTQWQLISSYYHKPEITQNIETLKQDTFELKNPIHFESLSELPLLVKQLNKSTP